jgi:hypothetical protein
MANPAATSLSASTPKQKSQRWLAFGLSAHEASEVDFSVYQVKANRFAKRVKKEGILLVHDGPSAASLKAIPEADFARVKVRRSNFAERIKVDGLTLHVGRGRPRAGAETGPTVLKSVRWFGCPRRSGRNWRSAPVRKASRSMRWSGKPSWRCFVESLRRFHPPIENPTNVGFSSLCAPGQKNLELRSSVPRDRRIRTIPGFLQWGGRVGKILTECFTSASP